MHPSLYEQVINQLLANTIDQQDPAITRVETAGMDKAEAADILSGYFGGVLREALTQTGGSGTQKLAHQVQLVNALVQTLAAFMGEGTWQKQAVDPRAEQLLAILDKRGTVQAVDERAAIVRPETSLAMSSLFTGAGQEPQLGSELKKEIPSCDRIDMLVSFIRWSGLRTMIEDLRDFTQNGGTLRIITTSYMGATEAKAIEALAALPNTTIKVSYDTKITRLHAKAYVFYRDTGFTTAYVGSSNLSNAALSSGLEWNVKVTATDLPQTIAKIQATFEAYWRAPEFEDYTPADYKKLEVALRGEKTKMAPDDGASSFYFEVRPYGFQEEILGALAAERSVRGHYKNLVVAATGTGKTVISAFDYKRYRDQHPGERNRLLFVAHREEILRQSCDCFRSILRDPNFGDLFVGNAQPESLDALFVSIQTFQSRDMLTKIAPDFYDFVIVDEFHHAAAVSYKPLLTTLKPRILLGLTATPERMDGQDITAYFDGRIAAEIRLPEAIDRKLLAPFQYFGVTDTVDLDGLRWSRGGYLASELEQAYVKDSLAAQKRAEHILRMTRRYVSDIQRVRGLGFCVSVAHAEFMADYFNTHGVSSLCVTGKTPNAIRKSATGQLAAGRVRFIFTVDVYNEGVDVPAIDTVLFLRPTESLTIFLQQLGRGLRHAEGKDCLTVLDFIGQANQHYSFEAKFAALLDRKADSVEREIQRGFVGVPKGCFVALEKVAQAIVLRNIRGALRNRRGIIRRLASFQEDTGEDLTLSHFLAHYHMAPDDLYKIGLFSRLCVLAGVQPDFEEPLEKALTRGMPRFCAVDSRRWIAFMCERLPWLKLSQMTPLDERFLRMTYNTLWGGVPLSFKDPKVVANLRELQRSPLLIKEWMTLLTINRDAIDFIDEPMDLGFDCPLDVYCAYSRDQILLALDYMQPESVREGVRYLEDLRLDVLFVTLNKSDKDYSPSTMYDDYALDPWHFHWQSQNNTSADSETGQRYIHHQDRGSRVLLFVREARKDAHGRTMPYVNLGLVKYESHQGERPMTILWRMERPIPAKFSRRTNRILPD